MADTNLKLLTESQFLFINHITFSRKVYVDPAEDKSTIYLAWS